MIHEYPYQFKIHDYLSHATAYITTVRVTFPFRLGFHLSHNLVLASMVFVLYNFYSSEEALRPEVDDTKLG